MEPRAELNNKQAYNQRVQTIFKISYFWKKIRAYKDIACERTWDYSKIMFELLIDTRKSWKPIKNSQFTGFKKKMHVS